MAIARGSATECAALIDVASVTAETPFVGAEEAKQLLERIIAMLTKLCRVSA